MESSSPKAAAPTLCPSLRLKEVPDSRFRKYNTRYLPMDREKVRPLVQLGADFFALQPGRMTIVLPPHRIIEMGVPGTKGLTQTAFSQVGLIDPKNQLKVLWPEMGHGCTLSITPGEKYVVISIPSRPENSAHK